MKVVVFGTSEFAVPVFDAVAERHRIAGVVTQPDRRAGRGHKLAATPVRRAAEARGLRVFTPGRLTPFVEEARALGADAFVVASYGKIVPQTLLDLVPIAFNVHPSLLPLYRGATPLQSAIRDGRTETGVTIIAMDAGMDTGDVLVREHAAIGPSETYGELHDRLAQRGAGLVVDALAAYEAGSLRRTPQRELAQQLGITGDEIARTLTHPLRKADLEVDWTRDPQAVVNLVRALAPQPLARASSFLEPLKIVQARAVRFDELACELGGTVATAGAQLQAGGTPGHLRLYAVRPGHDDAVVVDRVIAPNRGAMSGEAYAASAVQRVLDAKGR